MYLKCLSACVAAAMLVLLGGCSGESIPGKDPIAKVTMAATDNLCASQLLGKEMYVVGANGYLPLSVGRSQMHVVVFSGETHSVGADAYATRAIIFAAGTDVGAQLLPFAPGTMVTHYIYSQPPTCDTISYARRLALVHSYVEQRNCPKPCKFTLSVVLRNLRAMDLAHWDQTVLP